MEIKFKEDYLIEVTYDYSPMRKNVISKTNIEELEGRELDQVISWPCPDLVGGLLKGKVLSLNVWWRGPHSGRWRILQRMAATALTYQSRQKHTGRLPAQSGLSSPGQTLRCNFRFAAICASRSIFSTE